MLIHGGQYTAAELPARAHLGHAAAEYAASLAAACGVGRLLLFHHDPARTDHELEELLAGVHAVSRLPVALAREEEVIDVAAR